MIHIHNMLIQMTRGRAWLRSSGNRLGRTAEARASYERALGLTRQESERRFLERRLRELPDRDGE